MIDIPDLVPGFTWVYHLQFPHYGRGLVRRKSRVCGITIWVDWFGATEITTRWHRPEELSLTPPKDNHGTGTSQDAAG